MAEAERIRATGESASRTGRDPVNQPMVNNWVEAMGDRNPVYVDPAAAAEVHGGEGTVAPPAMAQVWTMYGLDPARDPADPLYATMAMLDEAGFTSVIATNCEQTYDRYLRPGDEVRVDQPARVRRRAEEDGARRGLLRHHPQHLVRRRRAGRDDDLPRPQVHRPATGAGRAARGRSRPGRAFVLRPQVNRDTAFFWEGTRAGELRVQRCGACGELRHPPGPVCPACHAMQPTYDVVSGRGTVYSYVVHRHPPVPGKAAADPAGAGRARRRACGWSASCSTRPRTT